MPPRGRTRGAPPVKPKPVKPKPPERGGRDFPMSTAERATVAETVTRDRTRRAQADAKLEAAIKAKDPKAAARAALEATGSKQHAAEAMIAAGLGADTGILSAVKNEVGAFVTGLPRAGVRTAEEFARGYAKGGLLEGATRALAQPQIDYVREKYGPLLPGGRPASETLEQVKREPLSTALDVFGFASAGTTTAAKAAMIARTPGRIGERVRAANALPAPRMLRSGEAAVQVPQSPNTLTRMLQRGYDRVSETLDASPLGDVKGFRGLSARSRAAKQSARNLRTDNRRRAASFAADAKAVKAIKGPARTGFFWERQLPTSARGGEGLQRVGKDFRARAKAAEEAGDAKAARRLRFQAVKAERAATKGSQPDETFAAADRLMAERRRIRRDAGFDDSAAEAREGLFARALGYEDATGAGYVGHRTERAPRAAERLGLTRPGMGKTRAPAGFAKRNELKAVGSGRVRTDPDVIVEDFQRALHYEFHNRAKRELAKLGEPVDLEAGPHRGWFVVNPEGHKLPRAWKDPDSRARIAEEGFDPDDVLLADLDEYARNIIAPAGSPEAAGLIEAAPGSVRQVPPEVVGAFFNRYAPSSGHSQGTARAAVETVDAAQDLVKGAVIYANAPGYVTAQVAGNSVMALAHQGAFLPVNLAYAARALKDKVLGDLIRAEIGMGPTVALASSAKNPVSRGVRKVAEVESAVADDLFRASAWTHEARKAGYRTLDKQRTLLKKAAQGDEQASSVANELRQRVGDAMVDFERLGPFERAITSRFLFVWPWIRGATRYPGRFALDRPVRSALATHAALEASEEPGLELHGRPDWLQDAIPVGPVRDGAQQVVNPRSLSTPLTPLELLRTIGGALSGDGDSSLLDLAHPGLRIAVDAATGRNRYGQRVGAVEAVRQDLERLSPAVTTARELVDPDSSPAIYGDQDRLEVVRRRIGRGVVPYRVDVEEAAAQADDLTREERAVGEATRERERVLEAVAEYFPEAPPGAVQQVARAYDRKAEREVAYARTSAEPGTVEFQRERYAADVGLLERWGTVTPEQAAQAREWAASASKAELEKQRRAISERFYEDEYLAVTRHVQRTLAERGAELGE